MHSMTTASSLELMLEQLQRTEYQTEDIPPALPTRPVSKARLPPRRRCVTMHKSHGIGANEYERKEEFKQTFDDIRTRARDDSLDNSESPENGVVAHEEWSFGDNDASLTQKIAAMDDTREDTQKCTFGIQKNYRGQQTRCCHDEIKRAIITRQPLVCAENARKKQNIARRYSQTQQTAVLLLQSVIRDWLSRRHLKYTENMTKCRNGNSIDIRNHETDSTEEKGYIHVPYSDVLDLQRRVLKTEAAVQNKKDENEDLRQRLGQYEKKWQLHEAKMKSMEKMWQEQLTSIQVSLAEAARRSHAAESNANQPRTGDAIPLQNEHIMSMNAPNSTVIRTGELTSDSNPEDELEKLKLRFEAWKKDYKTLLNETKNAFKKLGSCKVKKGGGKWWER